MFDRGKKYLLLATAAVILMPNLAKSDILKSLPKGLFSETPYKADTDPEVNLTDIVKTDPYKDINVDNDDIKFSADEMETNSAEGTVTAKGNVVIIRKSLTLNADEIIYNQKNDEILAKGKVKLTESSGNVIYSDYVDLKDKMDKIAMENIKVVMADKSTMAARKFRKYKNNNKLMEKAVYSPCDLCKDEDPLWQIKARKIRHNAETKDINYNDAFIEVKGVPVFYTPFFSHPDPTVKRRSGFLPPSFSTSNYFGPRVTAKYFWDISDNESLLFSPGISSKIGPIMAAEYSKYFYRGEMKLSGSYLQDKINNEYKNEDRGNLYLKGRYEINDLWVSDVDFKYVSDRAYLRDMSLKEKDDAWITSSLKLRRFNDRDYAAIEGYNYKRVSYDLRDEDKPYIIPFMEYQNITDPMKYGIYGKTDLSFASVYRRDEDSSYRTSMINSFVLPSTTSYGAKYKLMASLKTDFYYVDNYNFENENYEGDVWRSFPQLAYEWRLPFVKATESFRQIIEPIAVAVLSPSGGQKEDKIPNNDSRNPRLDDTNVLDIDRYAGYDVNDTGSRISYGMNWSSYGDITGRSSFLLAQSYKFRHGDTFSQEDSGSGYFSDYIGRFYANPHKYIDFNYRFISDRKDYDLKYSELSSRLGSDVLNAGIGYIFLRDENVDSVSRYNEEERKELYLSLNMALTKNWYLSIYNRQDLTDHGGSLEHGGKLVYEDECLIVATNVKKDNSNDPQYKGDFQVTLDFFLKTLGGVGAN